MHITIQVCFAKQVYSLNSIFFCTSPETREKTFYRIISLFTGGIMSDFHTDLETIRMHQITSGCPQNLFSIKSTRKDLKFLHFLIFFKYFFSEFNQKILFVNPHLHEMSYPLLHESVSEHTHRLHRLYMTQIGCAAVKILSFKLK